MCILSGLTKSTEDPSAPLQEPEPLMCPKMIASYKPFEPREGEPRQPNKAYWGLFGPSRPY